MLRKGGINFVALVCIQGANAVIPLLIVPLVLVRLGSVGYAQLAVAEAVSMLVVAFVLFSFEVDGVARVVGLSLSRDADALGDALSDIVSTRFVLFVTGAIAVLGVGTGIDGSFPVLLALYLLVPLGHVFHSYWFYQGVEWNVIPAISTLSARLLSVVLVVANVHSGHDQALVPLFIGLPFLIAGIASLAYTRYRFALVWRWAGFHRVLHTLRHGKEIFIGNASVTLYREMNVVLLTAVGVAAPSVAAYSLVEKIIKMIQACVRPLSQFFFPKVLRSISGFAAPSPEAARQVLRFTLIQVGLLVLLLAAIAVGYTEISPYWPWLAQFGRIPGVMTMFCIMAPTTIIGLANFMFGSAALNYLGARRYLLFAILSTGIASALLCLLLGKYLGGVGGAICFLFSEAFLLVLILGKFLIWPGDNAKPAAV